MVHAKLILWPEPLVSVCNLPGRPVETTLEFVLPHLCHGTATGEQGSVLAARGIDSWCITLSIAKISLSSRSNINSEPRIETAG